MTQGQITLTIVCILLVCGPPRWRAWRVALRLLRSKSVVIREFRRSDLSPDHQLSEKTLSTKEVLSLALVYALPQGWSSYPRCSFNPHHRIEITSASGAMSTVVVCFGCQMMQFYRQPATGSSVSHVGSRFDSLLRWLFRKFGIPVRPDQYQ